MGVEDVMYTNRCVKIKYVEIWQEHWAKRDIAGTPTRKEGELSWLRDRQRSEQNRVACKNRNVLYTGMASGFKLENLLEYMVAM